MPPSSPPPPIGRRTVDMGYTFTINYMVKFRRTPGIYQTKCVADALGGALARSFWVIRCHFDTGADG